METITRKAYAKVNLSLDVTGIRDDGYHDLRSVMQTIDLYDTLTFTVNDTGEVTLASSSDIIPTDGSNLIVRACNLMRETYDIKEGVDIDLVKDIPVEAGLGGGSADAACTLRAMNDLFALGLSAETLREHASSLGADVPFCIRGGTCLAEGIGEILTPLPSPPPCTVLVVKPQAGISTAEAYQTLDLKPIEDHPDVDALIAALRDGDLKSMCAVMGNVFEPVAFRRIPALEELENTMCDYGAERALMSGSGPAVFGIYRSETDAVKTYHLLKNRGRGMAVFVTRFL